MYIEDIQAKECYTVYLKTFPKNQLHKKLFDTPSHDNGFSRGEDTVGVATRQMPHPNQHRHCC